MAAQSLSHLRSGTGVFPASPTTGSSATEFGGLGVSLRIRSPNSEPGTKGFWRITTELKLTASQLESSQSAERRSGGPPLRHGYGNESEQRVMLRSSLMLATVRRRDCGSGPVGLGDQPVAEIRRRHSRWQSNQVRLSMRGCRNEGQIQGCPHMLPS